jgi:hypothetical protein
LWPTDPNSKVTLPPCVSVAADGEKAICGVALIVALALGGGFPGGAVGVVAALAPPHAMTLPAAREKTSRRGMAFLPET